LRINGEVVPIRFSLAEIAAIQLEQCVFSFSTLTEWFKHGQAGVSPLNAVAPPQTDSGLEDPPHSPAMDPEKESFETL
jgi:hypothetical protein